MMIALHGAPFDMIARLSAERLLNGLVQGIAVAFLAWIVLRVIGRQTSSTRFSVWFSALVAVAALPWIVPSNGMEQGAPFNAPGSWATIIFFTWATIASLCLLRVAVGLWQLRRLRAACRPVDEESLDPVLQKTLNEFRSTRPARLCVSEHLRVPTAIGFFRPAVVLPCWTLAEFSPAELNSILIHELAHLQRRDDWTNLAQRILRALLFFHPAVWWIENQLSLEREMACDDIVLARATAPRAYAECLVTMAEKSFMRRGLALAQAAVNRMRQTSLRVAQILDANRSGKTSAWAPKYLAAALSVVCIATISRAPQLVAFQDTTPTAVLAKATVPSAAAAPSPTWAKFTVQPERPLVSHVAQHTVQRKTQRPVSVKPAEARPEVASLRTEIPASLPTVLVVMQDEQYGPMGSLQWTIRVWRVTVWKIEQSSERKEIPAKSI